MNHESSVLAEVADRVWVGTCQGARHHTLIAGAHHALLAGDLPGLRAAQYDRGLRAQLQGLDRSGVTLSWGVLTSPDGGGLADRALRGAYGDRLRVLGHQTSTAPETVSSVRPLDLGGRLVEVIHPGPAHTSGDLVVRVADSGVDLVVLGELARHAPERDHMPAVGPESHPLVWAEALDLVLTLIGAQTLVVPGSGELVDGEFVSAQRDRLVGFAGRIRDLASRGVSLQQALDSQDWPWAGGGAGPPTDELRTAITLAYAQLGPGERRLRLV